MVPLAAPGLYFVSVRENPSAETPFQTVRVYLKRLPSGAYRVTVLSPSLPRPVFRMYPADVGEAEAVARAVGRALSTLENADCQLDEGNTASQGGTDNGSEKANGTRYLNRVAHDLPSPFPRSEQQPADEQRGADNDETAPVQRVAHSGHEVTQHGLVLSLQEISIKNRQPYCETEPVAPRGFCDAGVYVEAYHRQSEGSPPSAPQNVAPQPTQHRRPPLRLRVLWQGLL